MKIEKIEETKEYFKGKISVEVTQPRIDIINEVVYAQYFGNGTRSLHMTIFMPNTTEKKPCVVYFPGGGFTTSDYGKWSRLRMALALEGFIVAAVEYRPLPDAFPAMLIDGKAAVRYLRAHAEQFGIDTERIGVMGNSAGGYLAQLVAMTAKETEFEVGDYLNYSSEIQACCDIFGPYDFTRIVEDFSAEVQQWHQSAAASEALLVGGVKYGKKPMGTIAENKEKALWASPIGHLHSDLPPFLILHGTADKMVTTLQSEHLYNDLKACNVPATFYLLEDAGHGDDPWFQQPIIDLIVEWFKQQLNK